MATSNESFQLSVDNYAAFDALSLKSLIIKRLNESDVFTDQNFEGSNISAIIDIIAYAYNVLLFYLNQTASESTFSSATIYENINKIVKLLNYSPVGYQTALLPFKAYANFQIESGTYTIPRYSFFTVNGVNYSFNNDLTFTKTISGTEYLQNFSESNLLYQGSYTEYPKYFATGEPFELITMVLVDTQNQNIILDHFNIDVYVKDNTATNPKWDKWEPTQSLFLERPNSLSYEIRLNEDGRYEIKFGNNVNGKQLNSGDEVLIYYLASDGQSGQVGENTLNGNTCFLYNTVNFLQIKADTTPVNLELLNQNQLNLISFENPEPSTRFINAESVDNIKNNATNTFRSQFRLITTEDFRNYILKNYSNVLASVQVVNNWDYLSQHMKYYFDLGIQNPNLESRVLFNQVKFADSCNFNNIYVYATPKLEKLNSLNTRSNYLNSAQKAIIINDTNSTKLATAEIVFNDPVYIQFDLGFRINLDPITPEISDYCFLEITRELTSKRNPEAIRKQVAEIFQNYFSTTNDNLGKLISLTEISNQINEIDGVVDIKTVYIKESETYSTQGISFIAFNPVYPTADIQLIAQDTQLPFFKFPYLNNLSNFIDRVRVVTPSLQQLTEREF